jgi:hypothetical protein
MKNKLSFILLSLFILGRLSAQTFIGNINPFPVERSSLQQIDTLKILAVMVNFEEDRDAATFGNGKFGSIYSQNYGNDILDPLPHDRKYFENHLEFVKNYYNKVSKGNLIIEYTVLPDTFSVSQTMRNYSPPAGSDDFTPLGNFSEEVWSLASDLFPDTRFSDYNLFLIFHAGVGRDITLPGSLGNERDLPSVYLSQRALKNIFGPSFEGFPVQGGTFRINNSMIIPETESRELSTLTGTFLFEISINGLLVASVASHLGLPDLFNTETGLSAIGRFGLMDGQSIFAYNGTYPPEPSAWEKIYLGWAEYVSIDPGEHDISLVTGLAATLADTVILKVPLNSSEYFLIENRNRDVNSDGSRITYKIGDDLLIKTFLKDTTGYRSFDTDSLSGVIVDVDEFDWALPGNGILIWHIDENVINEKLADNKINVDKNRRCVNLKEADGIPDIGERFYTIFGDEVIGEGTQEDLWYSSNPSELYQNKLSKDSRPNSRTNTDANSLITISDFSDISNKMSFSVTYGDSIIKPVFLEQLYFNDTVKEISLSEDNDQKFLNLLVDDALKVYQNQTELRTINNFSSLKTASIFVNNTLYNFGVFGNAFNSFMNDEVDVFFGQGVIHSEITTSPVVVRTLTEETRILVGTDNGEIITFSAGNLPNTNPDSISGISINSEISILKITAENLNYAFIGKSKISSLSSVFGNNFSFTFEFLDEHPVDLAMSKDKSGNFIYFVLTNENNFYIFSESKLLNSFEVHSPSAINSFSISDLRKDGNIYIIFNNGNQIEARNVEGALADNYPLSDPENKYFLSTPLSMDFQGDDRTEIITFSEDGRIFAFDGPTGRLVDGFPISLGTMPSTVPVLFSDKGKPSIAVVDKNNYFSAWNIGSVDGKYYWTEKNGNNFNRSFISGAESEFVINEFFPKNKAYNYPNPVYEGQTYIRYFVSEEAAINIKIFDLAGGFVAELNDFTSGGVDSETLWDLSDIQSGVYLARIEAVSVNGKSESQVIKIAVVK